MSWRFKKDPFVKQLLALKPGAATGGTINSSDVGKMIVFTSGNGSLNRPCTNQFALTTADSGYATVAGILESISESSGADAGSTSVTLYVRPITRYDVLEVDYTTDTTFSSQAGDTALVSSNIGNYLHVLGAGTSSMSGSTAGTVCTPPTTDAMSMCQAAFIDASSALSARGSSQCFRIVGYSTKYKTVDVIFESNSTVDILNY